jgi:PAS domain S-box-containing protein
MKDWLSRGNRGRIFLSFLVLVLVIVNSQSLQLSYRTQRLLNQSFNDLVRARIETLAHRILPLLPLLEDELDASSRPGLSGELDRLAGELHIRSICLFDWEGRVWAGSEGCRIGVERSIDHMETSQKQALLESGWAVTDVSPRFDPSKASVFGYRILPSADDSVEVLLELQIPAANLAVSNRNLRSSLIYQMSAFALVLLTLLFYLNRLLAPHRRLVAEARTVVGTLGPDEASATEGEFLLSTFQGVVAQLKEKELELAEMHAREKARADETEALATDIIRSMTTGLVSLDESGVVILMNPSAEKIMRMEASSVVGKTFSEGFPGSADLTAWVDSALSQGESTPRAQVEYRCDDGERIHLGVNVVPLQTPEGRARGALCLLADLTEMVRLRGRVLLKDNLARLGEMTAGIAHEFRNGLSTILGNARLLKTGAPWGDKAELIDDLIEEGNSLNHVVSEFLQFARPEPLRTTTFDLAAVARDVASELEPRARQAQIDLSKAAESCRVEGDEVLLRKAVYNLALNAVEAAAGGPVEIRVERDEDMGVAYVRVSDNGPGIDAGITPRIFTPFFTTKPDGTGLGLALVQKIAVAHNGDVEVESEPGVKTVVSLRIPLSSQSPTSHAEWV